MFAIRKSIQEIEAKRSWTGLKTVVDKMGRGTRVPVFPHLEQSMFNGKSALRRALVIETTSPGPHRIESSTIIIIPSASSDKKIIQSLAGIRITTVDNYQGEESDIVIASFVRSNDDQRIGFLSKDNRVCVALSRAKKGFYCVGNIAMLAKASKTWENISRVLLAGNSVNKG